MARRARRRGRLPAHRLGPRVLVPLSLLALGISLLVAGCADRAGIIPSALDTGAIDVKAEPGPTQLPLLSQGVPTGSILNEQHWFARSDKAILHGEAWYDFAKERARWDVFGTPTFIEQDPSTSSPVDVGDGIAFSTLWADGQEVSYNAYSGDVRTSPLPAAAKMTNFDGWDTTDTVRLGRQTLNGVSVDVYRVDLNIPRGQERSADFGLIYVDSATGVRVRAEWLVGSPGHASVYHLYEYHLLPRTPELESKLTTQAMDALAAQKPG